MTHIPPTFSTHFLLNFFKFVSGQMVLNYKRWREYCINFIIKYKHNELMDYGFIEFWIVDYVVYYYYKQYHPKVSLFFSTTFKLHVSYNIQTSSISFANYGHRLRWHRYHDAGWNWILFGIDYKLKVRMLFHHF